MPLQTGHQLAIRQICLIDGGRLVADIQGVGIPIMDAGIVVGPLGSHRGAVPPEFAVALQILDVRWGVASF
jgi:hypothetical protein